MHINIYKASVKYFLIDRLTIKTLDLVSKICPFSELYQPQWLLKQRLLFRLKFESDCINSNLS